MGHKTADIAVIGFSHKTTPVEKRECFSVHAEVLPELYARFREQGIEEAVYVATCNRVETYIASRTVKMDIEKVTAIYESISGMPYGDFRSHLYVKTSREAAQHVLTVVSSLDSMVLGENEIVGQMREAFSCAVDNKSAGPLLNKLFHQAFRTAKQVKTETDISRNPLSVAYIATDLARKLFPDFQNRAALLIGAGEMGELILKYFTKHDIGRIIIANRSVNNSERIADEINRQAEIITAGGYSRGRHRGRYCDNIGDGAPLHGHGRPGRGDHGDQAGPAPLFYRYSSAPQYRSRGGRRAGSASLQYRQPAGDRR